MEKDYYSVLNVAPDASQAEIDESFHRLVQKRQPEEGSETGNDEQLSQVVEAWNVLSERTTRERYDAARGAGRKGQVREREASANIPVASQALPEQAAVFLQREFQMHWSFALALAIGVDLVLIASVTMLNDLGQFLWLIGITIGTWLAIYSLSRAIATRRAVLFGVASFMAGVVVASAAFLLLVRASMIPFRSPPAPLNVAVAAVEAPTATAEPGCPHGCTQLRPGCTIKAAQAGDRRVYYLPSDDQYAGLSLSGQGESLWFCTEAEAQANGWARYVPPPTATATPTATPTQTAAPTLAPTLAPTAKPTATKASAPRMQSAPRVSVVRLPTAVPVLPAVAAYKYQPPLLVSPSNGADYTCFSDLKLAWKMSSPYFPGLASDEWFVVESKMHTDESWYGIAEWTKDQSAVLGTIRNRNDCEALWWPGSGTYDWRVFVIRGDFSAHAIQQFLSEPSAPGIIQYKR